MRHPDQLSRELQDKVRPQAFLIAMDGADKCSLAQWGNAAKVAMPTLNLAAEDLNDLSPCSRSAERFGDGFPSSDKSRAEDDPNCFSAKDFVFTPL